MSDKLKNLWNSLQNKHKLVVVWVVSFILYGMFVSWTTDVKVDKKALPDVVITKNVSILQGQLKAKAGGPLKVFPSENNDVQIEFVAPDAKDATKTSTYWLTLPTWSWLSMEREVLFKDSIPYEFVDAAYFSRKVNKIKETPAVEATAASAFSTFFKYFVKVIVDNPVGIGLLILSIMMLRATTKGLGGMMGGNKFEVIDPSTIKGDMNDLLGMEDIKAEVLQLEDMYKNRELYRLHGVTKPFNIMLSGPAGTGKTKLAGYLAKRLNIPIIFASGSNLESGLVGGGSKTINNLYDKAVEQGKCIIFLDEAQALFMKRGGGNNKWEDDTANTVLAYLDGIKTSKDSEVIWIVASNFDDSNMVMDDAMLRRFALKISFRLPNKEERKAIIQKLLKNKDESCLDWDNIDLEYLANITANLSPANLEIMVERASLIVIQEKTATKITTDVLFRAFERVTIGLTNRETTENMDKQREIIATHEIGHFLMQVLPKVREGASWKEVEEQCKVLKISTEAIAKVNALGYVLSSEEDVALHSRVELEGIIKHLYGGVAAEELFYGVEGITTGSHNDIQKVSKIVKTMVSELGMYQKAKLNFEVLDLDPKDKLAEMETIAEKLYQETVEELCTHKELLLHLRDTLLDKFVLSKDDIFKLIHEYQKN